MWNVDIRLRLDLEGLLFEVRTLTTSYTDAATLSQALTRSLAHSAIYSDCYIITYFVVQ